MKLVNRFARSPENCARLFLVGLARRLMATILSRKYEVKDKVYCEDINPVIISRLLNSFLNCTKEMGAEDLHSLC